mgnify:CR=1 FL=1
MAQKRKRADNIVVLDSKRSRSAVKIKKIHGYEETGERNEKAFKRLHNHVDLEGLVNLKQDRQNFSQNAVWFNRLVVYYVFLFF